MDFFSIVCGAASLLWLAAGALAVEDRWRQRRLTKKSEEAVWHRLVREMDAAGLLQYELYRTGENTVTVVCSLQGLSAPAMEKRLACMRTGASDRVLEQVAERWNGLEERRGGR